MEETDKKLWNIIKEILTDEQKLEFKEKCDELTLEQIQEKLSNIIRV